MELRILAVEDSGMAANDSCHPANTRLEHLWRSRMAVDANGARKEAESHCEKK